MDANFQVLTKHLLPGRQVPGPVWLFEVLMPLPQPLHILSPAGATAG